MEHKSQQRIKAHKDAGSPAPQEPETSRSKITRALYSHMADVRGEERLSLILDRAAQMDLLIKNLSPYTGTETIQRGTNN